MDETKRNRAIHIGQQLGNYRLVGVLGQGKFAGSYLGEHTSSKQQVVIDVLQPGLVDDLVKSFFQQTYMLSQLTHPHILPIREAGLTENHLPFLVCDYVSHIPLQQLYPKGAAQSLTSILPHIQQIGTALQYAHSQNILHQHIHPGNILQLTNNEIVVCDFALDAIAQNKQRHSPGQVIDNIAYAAPEQIRGKACTASDQYSLAIMLYEWLSGDLPFHGSSIEIIRRHTHVPPPSLRQKAPMISPAIEEIIFTALAKEPTKRFATITAFVNALTVRTNSIAPSSAHKPASIAQPVTPANRFATQTMPTQAALAPTPFPVHQPSSTPGTPSGQAHNTPVPVSPPIQNALPKQAISPVSKPIARPKVKQEMTMTRRAFAMGFTALALAGGAGGWLALSRHLSHAASTNNVLNDANTIMGTPDAGGDPVLIYRAHPARVTSVAWSPDGKLIASASDDKLVAICNSSTGATLRTYHGHSAEVYAVAWSPDGKSIASASADKTVQVWDATTGNHLFTYNGHSGAVNSVAWSSDSTLLASGSDDKTVQVWNASTGNLNILYSGHTASVLSVAWSPDTTMVASGSWDNTLQAFSTIATEAFAVGDTVFSYNGHSAEVYAVAWSPDGESIASASGDKTVQICNGIDGKTLRTYKGHSNIVLALTWSRDSKRIASAGADTTIQVWVAANGQKAFTYHGHSNAVFATAWATNGKHIASAGSDNTMQVWQPA